jgi:3'-phosphoadenosine 5'-phosphosulfate sulfotransferase (PAPS reductase)/FAD synthetase
VNADAAESAPVLRVLSLGAGVQSTTLLLLAAEGRIPSFDAALFADTGWEPERVYAHLDRLVREVARPAGIPVVQVTATAGTSGRVTGNLRADSLDPGAWVRMPVFVADRTGKRAAMVRRQCTEEYKVKPIKAAIRQLLGYPHPRPVPRGTVVEQAIGISRDEFERAKDANVQYLRNTFPLLHLPASGGLEGWSRNDCIRYLTARGWASTPKSACIGCPFHGNAAWRDMRDHHPDEWADAVAFDHQLRTTDLRGIKASPYLHRSLLPLDLAPIDKVTYGEQAQRQGDLFDALADQDEADIPGCSPWSCHGSTDQDGAAA